MAIKKLPSNYPTFLAAVKQRIRASQYAALKSVNTELVSLYWELGRMIVERQVHDGWGAAVVLVARQRLQKKRLNPSHKNLNRLIKVFDIFPEKTSKITLPENDPMI